MESGGIALLLLPWLIAYTRRGDSRQRNAARGALLKIEAPTSVVSVSPLRKGSKWVARNLRAETRLEEVNREVRQVEVAVPGGGKHVGLRARALHKAATGSLSTTAPTHLKLRKGRRCLRRGATACQRSHHWWLSVIPQDQLAWFLKWTPGRPGRSLGPVVSAIHRFLPDNMLIIWD